MSSLLKERDQGTLKDCALRDGGMGTVATGVHACAEIAVFFGRSTRAKGSTKKGGEGQKRYSRLPRGYRSGSVPSATSGGMARGERLLHRQERILGNRVDREQLRA